MNTSDLIAEREALKARIEFFNVNTDKRQERIKRLAEIERILSEKQYWQYPNTRKRI